MPVLFVCCFNLSNSVYIYRYCYCIQLRRNSNSCCYCTQYPAELASEQSWRLILLLYSRMAGFVNVQKSTFSSRYPSAGHIGRYTIEAMVAGDVPLL